MSLSFSPSASAIQPGDSISVDITVSGLENSDLAAFGFDVNFDPEILAFGSYLLGNGLGSIDDGDAEDFGLGYLGNGVIRIAEFSYLYDFDTQPDTFSLATLTFTGIHGGISILSFSDMILSNEWDIPLEINILENGYVNVKGTDVPRDDTVPEPATLLLTGIGFIVLGCMKRAKNFVNMMRLISLLMAVLSASSVYAATPNIYDPTNGNRIGTRTAPCNVAGDLTGDCAVDSKDIAVIRFNQIRPLSACPECDIDGDGRITVTDARKLSAMFVSMQSPQIVSPVQGQTVSGSGVTVTGTVPAAGNQIGITVNGVPTDIYGSQFAAVTVPMAGQNTVTAVAADRAGNTAWTSVTVSADTAEQYIQITPNPVSGTSPFETTLKITGSFVIADSSLTATGPGTVQITKNAADEYSAKITGEGIYNFTALVNDAQNSYTGTVAVVVLSMAEQDAMFRAIWNNMKTALTNNNIEGALKYFHKPSQDNYRAMFTAIKDSLPAIASGMREIEFVYVTDQLAVYRLKRQETVQGATYDVSYNIDFMKDLLGVWKIVGF